MDPHCKVMIFMGLDKEAVAQGAPRHQQHSMVLVPMDTPGITVSTLTIGPLCLSSLVAVASPVVDPSPLVGVWI